jgi:ribosomal protein L9
MLCDYAIDGEIKRAVADRDSAQNMKNNEEIRKKEEEKNAQLKIQIKQVEEKLQQINADIKDKNDKNRAAVIKTTPDIYDDEDN